MQIAGSSKDSIKLLKGIDETKLVELTADLLTVRGHMDVKITEGPGDGSRDIYSVMPSGEKHLTQCKFHNSIIKAVSANELGELPLGLTRYGYSNGLFVTNARISPQAKRDYIDDYPGLTLGFLEGAELAPAVLGDSILRALWYEGQTLDRVTYAVVIPFIVRNLENGRPLALLRDTPRTISNEDIHNFVVDGVTISMKLQPSIIPASQFEPYRPPTVKTASENWFPDLHATEVILTGASLLLYLNQCIDEAISYLVLKTLTNERHKCSQFAIRQGKALLTPLGGESAGGRIELEVKPSTHMVFGTKDYDEWDWLLPNCEKGWVHSGGSRATQNEWVRWYNSRIDTCLNLRVISPPSQLSRQIALMQHSIIERTWSRSQFAVVPKCQLNQLAILPTVMEEWEKGDVLCAWLVSEFSSGLFATNIQPDDIDDCISLETNFDQELLDRISEQVTHVNGRLVDPYAARHMFAAVGFDPLPNMDMFEYRSADILHSPEIVPSPIDPKDRHITFDVCWCLNAQLKMDDFAELDNPISERAECEDWGFDVSFCIETDSSGKAYYFVHLTPKKIPDSSTTADYLHTIEPVLESILLKIENKVFRLFTAAKRATGFFWATEIGLIYPGVKFDDCS